MSASPRRVLPVVRWLRVGAAAAGLGIALAATPAVAWADDSPGSSPSDSASQAASRGGAPAQRSSTRNESATAQTTGRGTAGVARVSAQTNVSRAGRGSDLLEVTTPAAPQSASAVPAPSAAVKAPTATVSASATSPAASAASASISAPVSAPVQSKATAQSAPSAAPGLGSFSATLRLNLEDVFTGTGNPVVTNPTAVVTGLFKELLRRDPTATELQNYLNRLNLLGVNGVVAGLYSSDAFRQSAVGNYYLELLGRTPTQQELSWGAFRLALGTPEPTFAASIAGSAEFYAGSASGGGKYGTQSSATTYVDLLYRSLLGQATDPTNGAILVQELQAGQSIARTANQFVATDTYRTVKVGEVYQVLGQAASPTDIAGYVKNWFMAGGQGGISRSLLATTVNMQRIEAGLVTTPDVAAAADLQQLLLSAYNDTPEGFTKLVSTLLSLDPNNPIGKDNPCTASNTSCNQALFGLITTGGAVRGIPNSSLTLKSITANVATLVPSQNEIDLTSSLKFPLQDPDQLNTFFTGGVIQPFGNPVVTADGGTYIVDGHHRWSGIYLINPYTQVTALDIGYVPTPQTALKEAQMGVLATKGYLASATVQGQNLYTIDEPTFDAAVRDFIENAAAAHPKDPNPTVPWTDQVLKVFGKYLGFDPKTTPIDDQYTLVQNYLWGNVLRMRDLNPYIPGAPSRSVMPQTDPLPVTQGYLASGDLSYSFPTISYLG